MKKYKIGYTVGVFDLFHVGHLNLLEKCKEQCDYLIVGICNNDYVRDVKHKDPVIDEYDRARIVEALKCVDKVEIVDYIVTDDKMLAYNHFGFDVLFSGDDWKDSERYKRTEEQFSQIGVAVEYLPYTKGISTSDLKEKMSRKANSEL